MKPRTRKVLWFAILGIAAFFALLTGAALLVVIGLSQGGWG